MGDAAVRPDRAPATIDAGADQLKRIGFAAPRTAGGRRK